MLINGLRYITNDLKTIKEMTLSDYRLYMAAARLKRQDQIELEAIASFNNRRISQFDKDGKSVVNKIEDIIDISKAEREIFEEKKIQDTYDRLHEIAKRVQKLR